MLTFDYVFHSHAQERVQSAWAGILGKDTGVLQQRKVEITDEHVTSTYNLWSYPAMDALTETLLGYVYC